MNHFPVGYDFIGDIHGYAEPLHRLLRQMDYVERDGIYSHPERQIMFLGDYIDRGPDQIEVLRIVRSMCAAGNAHAIMGNHEYNAIGWSIIGENGKALRLHDETNRRQHQEFLDQVGEDSGLHKELVTWMRQLPIFWSAAQHQPDFSDMHAFAAHACWNSDLIARLVQSNCINKLGRFTDEGLLQSFVKGSPVNDAAEIILKGVEARLPKGVYYHDAQGAKRTKTRVRWWNRNLETIHALLLVDDDVLAKIPDERMVIESYDHEVPVFFGHYWMKGEPHLQTEHAVCLDFSVARNGVLAGYRFSGEHELSAESLIWVDAYPKQEQVCGADAPQI